MKNGMAPQQKPHKIRLNEYKIIGFVFFESPMNPYKTNLKIYY